MGLNVAKELARLKQMTVPELRQRHAEGFGEVGQPTPSSKKVPFGSRPIRGACGRSLAGEDGAKSRRR